MIKKGLVKLLAVLIITLVVSVPIAAFAYDNEYDIESASVTITDNGNYHIYGTKTLTTNTIVVNTGVTASIVLDNVNIDVSGTSNACAFDIQGTAQVNVVLADGSINTIKSGEYKAGLQLADAAQLTIDTDTGDNGILNVTGGNYAAGIGGAYQQSGGTIIIENGTINSNASYGSGAGIGSGNYGDSCDITINNGVVTANGTNDGAGIGSGGGGDVGSIHIHGGTIVAGSTGNDSGEGGSGIGSGDDGYNGEILIDGGTITANGKYDCPGIGGCYGSTGTITIGGSSTSVTATSGLYAAAIGGGYGDGGGVINIEGGTITANGRYRSPGIGDYDDGTTVINISGGTVVSNGGEFACGIGKGYYSENAPFPTLNFDGGSLSASHGASASYDISAVVTITAGNAFSTGGCFIPAAGQVISITGSLTGIFEYELNGIAENGTVLTALSESDSGYLVLQPTESGMQLIRQANNLSWIYAADASAPLLNDGTAERISDTEADITFTSNEFVSIFYEVTADGAEAPDIDTSGSGEYSQGETTLHLDSLTAGEWDIYIIVKDMAGNVSQPIKIDIGAYIEDASVDAFVWVVYDAASVIPTGPAKLSLPDGQITSVLSVGGNFWMTGAGFVEDTLYAVSYSDSGTTGTNLYTIDTATGNYTLVGNTGQAFNGFCYDTLSETAYAVSSDGSTSYLYSVNLSTGASTLIGNICSDIIIGIAADTSGNLLGIGIAGDSLYQINKNTGAATLIGALGIDVNYAQDIAYDRDNDKLYGTLYTNTGSLYCIDTSTGVATWIKDLGAELDGFAIPYDFSLYAAEINGTDYSTLDDALDAVESGDTIKLLKDITYNSRIWAGSSYNPSLTLDLNGHKLEISDVEIPIAAIDRRSVTVTDNSTSGGGILELNTTTSDSAPTGLTAVGTGSSVLVDSKVTTNIVSTADNGKGVTAYSGGIVELGNASVTVPISGSSTGVYADGAGSSISITGDISGGWTGVATVNGTVSIIGDVTTGYNGSGSGVRAFGGTIAVTGNVSSTGSGDYGAYADNGGTITVTGNVTSGSVGVAAYGGSNISVDGVISYSVAYIEMGYYANYLNEGNYEISTTKAGYRTYTDEENTVWVKIEAPYATNVTIEGDPVVGTTLTGDYDFHGATESGTTYRWLRNNGDRQLIASINSIAGVSNNPYNPSIITLPEAKLITYINTYHYYNGGQLPGTIALQEVGGDETVYGPWNAVGTPGQGGVPDAYWNVYPNVTLPAGSYQVIDSDPATWSWASDTGGRGIVAVYGNPDYDGTYTPIDGATEKDYTLSSADGGCMIKFEVTVEDSEGISGNAVTSDAIGPIVSELQLSSDATLSDLSVTGVTITPAFSSDVTSYTASVANSVNEVTINAEPNISNAVVTIGGTTVTTKDVALNVGSNVVTVEVTAEDGVTTKTYTITITRASAGSGGGGTPIATGSKVTFTTTDGSVSVTGTLTETDNGTQVVIKNGDFNKVNAADKPASINAQLATVTFDKKAIDTIGAASGSGDVILTVRRVPVSELSEGDVAKVGERPVYDFTVTSGGKTVSDFKGGHATVTIPYSLKSGENPNAIVIYNLADDGTLKIVRGFYDADLKAVVFRTTHFSRFTIGYSPVFFIDVKDGAWYKDAIDFIAARSITSGTSASKFSPDVNLTRAQFVVLLMNAYQISIQSHAEVNFADAGNTYYTDYLAAAKGLGIVNGVGNNLFAPDKEITREEMFVMLYNALKVIDEVPASVNNQQLSSYNDASDIAVWAKEAFTSLINAGVVVGNNNFLYPTSNTTRAEIAQVLYKLLSK